MTGLTQLGSSEDKVDVTAALHRYKVDVTTPHRYKVDITTTGIMLASLYRI